MLHINPTDLVLEIGSGNRPRRRSNVLCDKFLESNTERSGGEALVVDNRPFVVADGHSLPFKDKCFDYVITSHILEHVEDPRQFVSELSRVARAGYIETPAEIGEAIFGWPFHRWRVHLDGDTIVLRPRIADSPFGEYFHRMYESDPVFAEFVDSHFAQFYVQYEWVGSIRLRVDADPSGIVRPNVNAAAVEVRTRPRLLAISMVRLAIMGLLKIMRRLRKFDTGSCTAS